MKTVASFSNCILCARNTNYSNAISFNTIDKNISHFSFILTLSSDSANTGLTFPGFESRLQHVFIAIHVCSFFSFVSVDTEKLLYIQKKANVKHFDFYFKFLICSILKSNVDCFTCKQEKYQNSFF